MATEVLLMSDVKDLGAEGDVVHVADGYARNYLFPQKLGAPVTEATRRQLEKLRRDREEQRKAELQAAGELANHIQTLSITIAVKTGEDGKLFGSVTNADIAEALKKQGVELDRHKLELEQPLRELGVFDVKVRLHPEVEGSVKVWVVEE